jgi:DNA replication protein DnaC
MDEWLTAFKERHSLVDVPLGADKYLVAERAARAAQYAAKHVPARFENAVPALPEVECWVAEVIRAAVTESQARGQQVATVHRGPSLLLLGGTGVGKTHPAYGAMRVISLFGLHTPWVVISAADVYARMRPRPGVDAEAEFAAIADVPLLAVDDLGAAKHTEWVEEINFRLVNRRYEAMRPTLFTSNHPPRDVPAVNGRPARPGLPRVLGERVTSRLVEMCEQVAVRGEDRRRTT